MNTDEIMSQIDPNSAVAKILSNPAFKEMWDAPSMGNPTGQMQPPAPSMATVAQPSPVQPQPTPLQQQPVPVQQPPKQQTINPLPALNSGGLMSQPATQQPIMANQFKPQGLLAQGVR